MPQASADRLRRYRDRTIAGPSPTVYRVARWALLPLLRLYFRLSISGAANIPASGPVIIAPNHKSFLDPFLVAAATGRPICFVAKQELFARRWQGWLLNQFGAFPIRRGQQDHEALEVGRAVLRRGGALMIFPEGTRVRDPSS